MRINSLGGLVSNSNLYKPADEFRGLYPTPPEPIGGVRAETWHNLGRDLAVGIVDNIIGTALYADGVLCEVIYNRSMSNEQIDAILRQWPAVQAYLRDEAPRFDCRQLVAMIEDEAARSAARAFPPAVPAPPATVEGKGNRTTRRRRAGTDRKPRPLTARQAEVIQIVGECKGNVAKAAERLGLHRKTVAEAYKAGLAKLGKTVVKHATRLFPRDRRGQDDVSEADDMRRS